MDQGVAFAPSPQVVSSVGGTATRTLVLIASQRTARRPVPVDLSPKTTAKVYGKGFSFFDAKPLPDDIALDLLTSMGLGDVVADYLVHKNYGWDLRGFLAYTLAANLEPADASPSDVRAES